MRRRFAATVVLVVLLLALAAAAVFVGAADLPGPLQLLGGDVDPAAVTILQEIRLPRVVAAALAGLLIAIAGGVSQGVFANPVAEPTLMGTTASAALGSVVVFALVPTGQPTGLALVVGFSAAWLASVVTLRLQARRRLDLSALVVFGVAIAALANGLLAIVAAIADDPQVRSVGFWTNGTLAFTTWSTVVLLAPLVVLTIVTLPALTRRLDLLSLGDIQMRLLGHSPAVTRTMALGLVSAIVAAGTVSVGALAFLGLAAPHIARALVGPSHRAFVWISGLVGAVLLIAADTVARTVVAPAELPISVVTALLGAPFLIGLMLRLLGGASDRTA